jgi:isopentenyl-diphosphate Delta-isomerase
MSENIQKLNIVNDQDEIIGVEPRDKIHRDGLLHREIHIWFYTPKGEIIFQHRAKDKDTFPDLLDATVGGHVEVGDSYEKTAIKEAKEETGLDISPGDLINLIKIKRSSEDEATKKINNVFRQIFLYKFTCDISELKIEEGKSVGFEVWPIDALLNPKEGFKKKFIPGVFSAEMRGLFEKIKTLI